MGQVLNKKLLLLILKVLYKNPEIEYLHYVIQIVNHALMIKDLRAVMITEPLKPESMKDEAEEENKSPPLTYIVFLKNTIEKTNEVISISKLHQKVVRQRLEIESWASAHKLRDIKGYF